MKFEDRKTPTQVICDQVLAYLDDDNITSDEMDRLKEALAHLKDAARFRAGALQVREQIVSCQTPISAGAVTQAFVDHDTHMQLCRSSSAYAKKIFCVKI